MSEQLVIESPDFDQIRKESGRATEDAIRLLWYALNEENKQRRQQRWSWVDVPHSAITFTSSAGTWTVGSADLNTYRYTRLGDMVMIFFNFASTSTSAGMGTELYFTLPYGLNAKGSYFFEGVGVLTGGGVSGKEDISVYANTSNRQLVTLLRATAWPSSRTNDLNVGGFLVLQVE